ncbi:hypothetical protein D3C87_1955270 [compost metagenome]
MSPADNGAAPEACSLDKSKIASSIKAKILVYTYSPSSNLGVRLLTLSNSSYGNIPYKSAI